MKFQVTSARMVILGHVTQGFALVCILSNLDSEIFDLKIAFWLLIITDLNVLI